MLIGIGRSGGGGGSEGVEEGGGSGGRGRAARAVIGRRGGRRGDGRRRGGSAVLGRRSLPGPEVASLSKFGLKKLRLCCSDSVHLKQRKCFKEFYRMR